MLQFSYILLLEHNITTTHLFIHLFKNKNSTILMKMLSVTYDIYLSQYNLLHNKNYENKTIYPNDIFDDAV